MQLDFGKSFLVAGSNFKPIVLYRNLVITPGKPEAFIPQSDLRITNVALGDELADESGRTTVKLTYQTLVDIDDDESADEEAPQEPISTTVLCSLTAGKVRGFFCSSVDYLY